MKYILGYSCAIMIFSVLIFAENTDSMNAKKVFETYCWGCHHQSAEAFGPSFASIAAKRSAEEIEAMIADPEAMFLVLGYKRNAMPAFTLKDSELKAISEYILSFKGK